MVYIFLDMAGPPCSLCMSPIRDGWYAQRTCIGRTPGANIGVVYTDSRPWNDGCLKLLVCMRCAMKRYPDDYVDSDGNLLEDQGHFIWSGLVHEMPNPFMPNLLTRETEKGIEVKEENETENNTDAEGEGTVEDVKDEIEMAESRNKRRRLLL